MNLLPVGNRLARFCSGLFCRFALTVMASLVWELLCLLR
jgi:hypothetical protein